MFIEEIQFYGNMHFLVFSDYSKKLTFNLLHEKKSCFYFTERKINISLHAFKGHLNYLIIIIKKQICYDKSRNCS